MNNKFKWTPVEEKLPSKQDEYLVTWTTSTTGKMYMGICEFDGDEFIPEEHTQFYEDVRITAWMPLPNPHKTGEKR